MVFVNNFLDDPYRDGVYDFFIIGTKDDLVLDPF